MTAPGACVGCRPEMDLFSYQQSRGAADGDGPSKPGAPPLPGDPPVLSVGQLCRQLRGQLERQFSGVWLRGEISNHRRQASGHHYFTLKDAEAQLSCVLFRGAAQQLRTHLADGLQVQVLGDVSVYEPRGQMQMIVRKVQEGGAGALQAKFEALKRRLADEGLFAPERKQPIPEFPQVIAVVTSPTGAAIQDMLNILHRRSPWVRVLVFPVRVQGDGAHQEIARALDLLGQPQPDLPRIDTVVVARGGGSLEDLWSFNEESVARAIAGCPLPVISAVGHEIDFTIADFAADLRAPTPSVAAELVAPDGAELAARLQRWNATLRGRVGQIMVHLRQMLNFLEQSPLRRAPQRWLAENQQTLDRKNDALCAAAEAWSGARRQQLELLAHRLEARQPAAVLSERRVQVELLRERLEALLRRRFDQCHHRIDHLDRLLHSLGPEAVLSRGFSLTLDLSGTPVRSASALRPGQRLRTRLSEGEFVSIVDESGG